MRISYELDWDVAAGRESHILTLEGSDSINQESIYISSSTDAGIRIKALDNIDERIEHLKKYRDAIEEMKL